MPKDICSSKSKTGASGNLYKVVQIWPGLFVCKQAGYSPGHIWTTLYFRTKAHDFYTNTGTKISFDEVYRDNCHTHFLQKAWLRGILTTLPHRIHIQWRFPLKMRIVKNYTQIHYSFFVQHVLSDLFLYLLTPWSRVLLEKLTSKLCS